MRTATKRERHCPMRRCMGCGQPSPQADLWRVKLTPEGQLWLAARGGLPGRSGYLHRNPGCCGKFAARRGPVRSLGRPVDREVRRAFIAQLQAGAEA